MRRAGWRRLVAALPALLLVATGAQASVRAASASGPALAVHVVGNHLVDGTGQVIQLRGVDRSGSEFACSGEDGTDGWNILDTPGSVTLQQQVTAMQSWDVNAVRVPLNEDCWLGINGVPDAYSGSSYQQAIESFVQLLNSNGMVAILDLHLNAAGSQVSDSTDGEGATGQQVMADESHAPAFWSSVAAAFAADPAVIFDLYNEPNGISWSCWLDGGCLAPAIDGTTGGWAVAGMQQLVGDIRATGADQPIMIGGLDWANDLSQWLDNEPTDTLDPPQLVASVHVYEGESCSSAACWNSTIAPVAATVPVVTGELGPSECDGTFVDDYMDWADLHGVSYLAWNWGSTEDGWSCAGSPALLLHDDGTPDAYGSAVEAHYQADASTPSTTTTAAPATTVPATTAPPATTVPATTSSQSTSSPSTSAPSTSAPSTSAPSTSTPATTLAHPTTTIHTIDASSWAGGANPPTLTPSPVRVKTRRPFEIAGRAAGVPAGTVVVAQLLRQGRWDRTGATKVGAGSRFRWKTGPLAWGRNAFRFLAHHKVVDSVVVLAPDRPLQRA